MICGNASHFFGHPVSDRAVGKADSSDYGGATLRRHPDGDSAAIDDAMVTRVPMLPARPEASCFDARVSAGWGESDSLASDLREVRAASRGCVSALQPLMGEADRQDRRICGNPGVCDLWPLSPALRDLHLHAGTRPVIADMELTGLELAGQARLTLLSCARSDQVVGDGRTAGLLSRKPPEARPGWEDPAGSGFADRFGELRLPDMPALKLPALRDCEYAGNRAVMAWAPFSASPHAARCPGWRGRRRRGAGTSGFTGAGGVRPSSSFHQRGHGRPTARSWPQDQSG